jgi:outer membrane receptor protein involved in Fe transport
VLAGAPKFSGNLFANFSYPLDGKVLHANANYNFQTGYYSDTSLSRYLFTKSMGVTDINVGIGRKDGKFDISLLVKNALNVNTDINVGSPGSAISLKPGIPRWAGVVLNAEY